VTDWVPPLLLALALGVMMVNVLVLRRIKVAVAKAQALIDEAKDAQERLEAQKGVLRTLLRASSAINADTRRMTGGGLG
jgi:uncharacterized membrane-anchored protein YhcB (DUF1043 family)